MAPQSNSAEELFLEELNIFKNEVETVIRFVYSESGIQETISKNKGALRAMNKNPMFWNSVLGSLTTSTFIVLGRIFDTGHSPEKHSIHTLFKVVSDNRNIFSKAAFGSRWDSAHPTLTGYKQTYMTHVYDMTPADWRKLSKLKKELCKQYVRIYRPIRNMIGHRILIDNSKIQLLMSKAKVREMEKFCTKLKNLHEGLWQLYHNGRGPIIPLRMGKYSSKGFVRAKYLPYVSGPLASLYTKQAQNTLNLLKKGLKT